MKKNIIKSLILTCFLFVFGIGSAFALKNVGNTYAISYSATFYANGGTWADGSTSLSKTITYDNRYLFTEYKIKISKPGCTFAGWTVGSTTGNLLTQYIDSAENGKNLYAKWTNCSSITTPEVKYYYVDFNTNGGSGTFSKQKVQEGLSASKPSKVPIRSNYTFLYWSASMNGPEYNFSTKLTRDLTLYAVWKANPKKYTVSFDLNGASGSIPSQTITEGGKVSKPSNPTWSGYTFLYWSTSKNGSSYSFSNNVGSSFTLYAIWQKNQTVTPTPNPKPEPTPNPAPNPSPNPNPAPNPTPSVTYYTVNFNLNGGTGNIDSQSIAKGNKASKPDSPTKENATFDKWSTSKECTSTYDFNTSVTSNITLYACYINNYKVTFNKQGLPYIDAYTKTYKEKSNLQEYNSHRSLIIADTTTYSMLDKTNCSTSLKELYPNLTRSELETKCDNLNNILKCQNNDNCYASKYALLGEIESQELVKLKSNNVVSIEYETYNYLGLYRDRECETEYKYSDSITKNLTLYECYSANEKNPNIGKPSNEKKKKGLNITVVLMISALIAVILFVLYLVRKSKLANSVN